MNAAIQFQAFDLLATLVAVVAPNANVVFSNAALEDALGISRRAIVGSCLSDVFTEPSRLQSALSDARKNAFSVLRYDAFLKRGSVEPLPTWPMRLRTL